MENNENDIERNCSIETIYSSGEASSIRSSIRNDFVKDQYERCRAELEDEKNKLLKTYYLVAWVLISVSCSAALLDIFLYYDTS